ncbi:carbohydrate kinase family protein [Flexivirga sp. ID2601S]|uniref:Carbohydrate kinase family protein n=1 Tax=Flexivirga aerilata TaxID=1656889 RepID=A0A849AFN7_9MICO|nr:carbohydrate kinase family protein [Flexivirga aerilata]
MSSVPAAPAIDPADRVDVLVVGTVFLDVIFSGVAAAPEPGTETWATESVLCPGGIANNAVAAARLGAATCLVAPVGPDPAGDFLLRSLRGEAHLDVRVPALPGVRTPVTAAFGNGADRAMISHGRLDPVPVGELAPRLPQARACFVSLQPGGDDWFAAQRAGGARVYAGVGYDERHDWSGEVLGRLAGVDALVLNEIEALAYSGRDDVPSAAAALTDHVERVVVTCGRGGVHSASASASAAAHPPLTLPGERVAAVDATGAGDVFTSGLMCADLLGLPTEDALRFAQVCAALSVRGLGGAASAPTLTDVRTWCRDSEVPGLRRIAADLDARPAPYS